MRFISLPYIFSRAVALYGALTEILDTPVIIYIDDLAGIPLEVINAFVPRHHLQPVRQFLVILQAIKRLVGINETPPGRCPPRGPSP